MNQVNRILTAEDEQQQKDAELVAKIQRWLRTGERS